MADRATDDAPAPPLSSTWASSLPRASYHLTAAAILASVGAGVFCLDMGAVGQSFRLHTERPGADLNERRYTMSDGSVRWMNRAAMLKTSAASPRADLPSGAAHVVAPVESARPLIRVDASGPLEQRAGYHDPCGGYSDGHDALAERLCAAFAEGDVLFVVDGPGGAAAGIQQAVERVLAAKEEHGRRATGYGDERVASAHLWWLLAVCDEAFIPQAGILGSVGARGEHMDISGAMAMEGLKKTYFADPPDKVALAPEFPLSPVGEARGNRDVNIAASAFRAAVCAGPVGLRYGLTPEALIDLGADMLTGEAAVGIFADGVESFPAVVAYALALAESEAGSDARTTDTKITGAAGAKEMDMSLRMAEGEEPEKKDNEGPESDRGAEIPTKCAACGVENDKVAKFCMGCGESMATKPMEEEEPEPPSSKPKPGASSSVATQMRAPRAMPTDASLASILGATSDSALAITTAAIKMRQLADTARGITGKSDASEVIGGLLAIPSKLARGDEARRALAETTEKTEVVERWTLAHRLAALPKPGRSKVLADVVDSAGARRLDAKGKPQIRIRTRYATMDLGTLRGLVTDLEGDAPRRVPFEASRDAAADASQAAATEAGIGGNAGVPRLDAKGEPSAAQIAAAAKHPLVVKMFREPGNTAKLDDIARQFVLSAAQNGMSIGGA